LGEVSNYEANPEIAPSDNLQGKHIPRKVRRKKEENHHMRHLSTRKGRICQRAVTEISQQQKKRMSARNEESNCKGAEKGEKKAMRGFFLNRQGHLRSSGCM